MDENVLENVVLDLVESIEAGVINRNLNNSDVLISGQIQHTSDKDSENTNQNEGDVRVTLDKEERFELETDNDSQKINNNNNKQKCELISNSENINVSEVIVKTKRPLCADYRSDSGSDSLDEDSSTSTAELTSETSSDSESSSEDLDSVKTKKGDCKTNTNLSFSELPPIEELRISVPEDDCIEIGTITSIVDALVVVESFKGTPALDVDTVLFLDCGKRTLGKVFDILGPISEPVYTVRFNSQEQIKDLQIHKGLKVYCAPKTSHTSFIFLSEIIKHKGSDASWKDNIEAPAEFQDFSDDEEERRHKMNKNSNGHEDGSRKRPFSKIINMQPVRFRPQNPQHRPHRFPDNQQRFFTRPDCHQAPTQPFQYNVPLYPGNAVLTGGPPLPHMYFTPRFSGPPFPSFAFHGQRIQQPFYQQRMHASPLNWRPQYVVVPPPPPPPPAPSTSNDNSQNFAGQP